MEIINNLRWESIIPENGKDWVTVTPPNGTGDINNVKIIVTNSDVYSTNSKTKVVFRCLDCKPSVIEKEVEVCRCICDCSNLKNVEIKYDSETKTVPEEGLAAGTEIGTYTLTDRCSKEAVSATIKKGNDSEESLTCENGSIKLKNAITYNKTFGKINFTVNVYFDRGHLASACETFDFKQDGMNCECQTVLPENSFTVSISTFGVTAGGEIGTYKLTEGTFCPENLLTATLKNKTTEEVYNLVCSEGKVYLPDDKEIEENTGKDAILYTLTVFYNNEECDSADISQEGKQCNCDNITIEKIKV